MYSHHIYLWSSHIARVSTNRVRSCQSCSWSAKQGNIFFSFLRSRLRIWTHETGSAVASCISLLIILHTQVEPGTYSRDPSRFPHRRLFIYLKCHPPSSDSGHRVTTQLLRTDGVYCRESADTGPVLLKVVPEKGATFASPWTNT